MRSFIGASTRNRVLVIIGVIAVCLWIVYPVQESLKLGLDLNGGVQLVLRVKTRIRELRRSAATRSSTRRCTPSTAGSTSSASPSR